MVDHPTDSRSFLTSLTSLAGMICLVGVTIPKGHLLVRELFKIYPYSDKSLAFTMTYPYISPYSSIFILSSPHSSIYLPYMVVSVSENRGTPSDHPLINGFSHGNQPTSELGVPPGHGALRRGKTARSPGASADHRAGGAGALSRGSPGFELDLYDMKL